MGCLAPTATLLLAASRLPRSSGTVAKGLATFFFLVLGRSEIAGGKLLYLRKVRHDMHLIIPLAAACPTAKSNVRDV